MAGCKACREARRHPEARRDTGRPLPQSGKPLVFALAGNQNSGKTTLFNQLTGANQHVGNFPGVTVDRKDGVVRGHPFATVVDLPGIYSLSPYTSDEIVTRDFLIDESPDAIINIVDATNIERNLYLTLQLIELAIPMVVALNMMDEMRASGSTVDIHALSEALGVPVVPISAVRNEGIHELVDTAIAVARAVQHPAVQDFCSGPVHRAIHGVAHIIEDLAAGAGVPKRFAATKLVEGDAPMVQKLSLSENAQETIGHMVLEMEQEMGTDREAALADMRYRFIEDVVARTVAKKGESRERARSVRVDAILTHRIFALPIFLGVMLLVFYLTFDVIGQPLSDRLLEGVDFVNGRVDAFLTRLEINPIMRSLIVEGALTGVGTVLGFLPVIITLFFFLSLLEDSGYMARIAFVMDKPLRRIGLSGRSIVPMLLGFGCTVPATMATRTLASERDRKMTILLTPYMSCSAKLPIYGAFTAAFFPQSGTLVMLALYLIGIVAGIVNTLLMKRIPYFEGKPVPFVMELPNYRLPGIKSVLLLLWEKAKDFLTRAFTVIFIASLVIWFLQTFDLRFNPVADQENSILALVARGIAPVFRPVGFGFWQAAVALITGFMAKELVVSTLAVLSGTTVELLPAALGALFAPAAAFSFLVFTLLYTPCIAAVATVRRELRSGWAALGVLVLQCVVAWVWAFAIYHLLGLF